MMACRSAMPAARIEPSLIRSQSPRHPVTRTWPRAQGVIAAKTCQTLGMTAVPAVSRIGHARTGLHEPCVLLKLGEIVLKGKNRQQFERLLQNNIRLAASDLGLGIRLWQRDGVIVLNPAPASSPDPAPPPDRGRADRHAETADGLEAAQVAADRIAERMLRSWAWSGSAGPCASPRRHRRPSKPRPSSRGPPWCVRGPRQAA